jgi:hypothetical protein
MMPSNVTEGGATMDRYQKRPWRLIDDRLKRMTEINTIVQPRGISAPYEAELRVAMTNRSVSSLLSNPRVANLGSRLSKRRKASLANHGGEIDYGVQTRSLFCTNEVAWTRMFMREGSG